MVSERLVQLAVYARLMERPSVREMLALLFRENEVFTSTEALGQMVDRCVPPEFLAQ